MTDLGTRLLTLWRDLDIPFALPATESQLCHFENHYHLTSLPPEFRSYLRVVNGMQNTKEWNCDDELVTFWNLPIRPEEFSSDFSFICPAYRAWKQCREEEGQRLFVFADWCINGFALAINLDQESNEYGSVSRLMDNKPERISPSFECFLNVYLENRGNAIFADSPEAEQETPPNR